MNFEVNTDFAGIEASIHADVEEARHILAMQILVDCNYFCKQDQSGLIASSISESELERGELIWDTVYAVMQYYLGAASHEKNSNATKMWCEKAYAVFGKDWNTLLQKLFEMNTSQRSALKGQLQSELKRLENQYKGGE